MPKIAGARNHTNTLSIFLLNLFLGWTFLGWIGALVWSFTSASKAPTVIVNNSPLQYSQEYQTGKAGDFQQAEDAQKKGMPQQHKIDQLRQFKQLLDEGVITREEFDKQKAAILGE